MKVALLLEILQTFATAPIVPLDAEAIAVFDQLRSQQVREILKEAILLASVSGKGSFYLLGFV